MKIFILIVLIPLAIIKFIIGSMKAMLGVGHLKYIPKLIQELANKSNTIGTAINELKFPQVLAWAEVNGTVLKQGHDFFEFFVRLPDDGFTYKVKITRAPDDSNCAIFRSERHSDIPREDKFAPDVRAANRKALKYSLLGVLSESDEKKYSAKNPELRAEIEDLIIISFNAFGAEIEMPYLKYSTLCDCIEEYWLSFEYFPKCTGVLFGVMIKDVEYMVDARTTEPNKEDDSGVVISVRR